MTFKRVTRDAKIHLEFVGLLPNTIHYLYVDTEKILSSFVKPEGGLCGDALVSDANGRLVLDYYRVTGAYDVKSRDQASIVNNARIVKKRRYVVSNVNSTTLDNAQEATSRSMASVFF